jgi:hypothetical protein
MTFVGLILRFALGYGLGLILGPHIRPGRSSWREVSIGGAVAGALGASAPYVLLHSIWVQYLIADGHPASGGAVLLIWLGHNVTVVCLACCIVAIIAWGLLSNSRPNPLFESASVRHTYKKNTPIWLLLCLPAASYSLWMRLSGQPIGATWCGYLVGSLFVVGILGYMVSSAAMILRRK